MSSRIGTRWSKVVGDSPDYVVIPVPRAGSRDPSRMRRSRGEPRCFVGWHGLEESARLVPKSAGLRACAAGETLAKLRREVFDELDPPRDARIHAVEDAGGGSWCGHVGFGHRLRGVSCHGGVSGWTGRGLRPSPSSRMESQRHGDRAYGRRAAHRSILRESVDRSDALRAEAIGGSRRMGMQAVDVTTGEVAGEGPTGSSGATASARSRRSSILRRSAPSRSRN